MEKEKNILNDTVYKKNPFEVPGNYFPDFSKNLEDKITLMENKPKTVSLFEKMRPWMYIAASLLLFMGGIHWYVSKMVGTETELVENTEIIEMTTEEANIMLAYVVDDLTLIDYLISEENN